MLLVAWQSKGPNVGDHRVAANDIDFMNRAARGFGATVC
jgi:hypothetical protein